MKISNLLVLYDKNDSEIFLNSSIKVEKILTLTPDSFLMLFPKHKNILRSLDLFTDLDHKLVIEKVRDLESTEAYINLLDSLKKDSVKEVFKSKLHIFLNMFERLNQTIPLAQEYVLISNSHIKYCKSKNDFLIKLISKIIFENGYLQTNIKYSAYSVLIKIINKVSLRLISDFQVIIYSGNHYGLPALLDEYNKYDSNILFVRFRGSKNNIRDLVSSLQTLFKIILRQKKLVFTVVPKKIDYEEFSDVIGKIANSNNLKDILNVYEKPLMMHLAITHGLYLEFLILLKKIKPKLFIAHEMKSNLNSSLAESANHLNVDSYLISHGTHVQSKLNPQCNYEQKEMATGVLASKLSKYNIVQSSIAKDAMRSFFPLLKFIQYKPIMWGNIGNNFIHSFNNNNNTFKILHASTFKAIPATRPWIFETSDEFYEGIKDLIDVVSEIENIHLTIRMRNIPECSLKWIVELASTSANVQIKSDGTFIEDLLASDLLISNSSTTVEEALTLDKSVLLWGYGARYSHSKQNLNNNRINDNAIDIESLKKQIIKFRNNKFLSKQKNNTMELKQIQSKEFVVNSLNNYHDT